MKGLYIHVPFCTSKCGYCDFYSVKFDDSIADLYVKRLLNETNKINDEFDTVYFGGGTPSLLGGERIRKILKNVNIAADNEITVECNPSCDLSETFKAFADCGVNRISIGLQSAVDSELKHLTRRHNLKDVKKTICDCKKAKIENISLDIMIGTEGQNEKTLGETLDFCVSEGVPHISAYMLKREKGTKFYELDAGRFPDDDVTADLYLQAVEKFENNHINQYEISNFAKKGYESRHNLIYWNCDDYLGLGPSAHSFLNGKRFFYKRNLDEFINNPKTTDDGNGGDFNEYFMLRLRLTEGFVFEDAKLRGYVWNNDIIERAKKLENTGYIKVDSNSMHLTREGFLLQNQIISRILYW